LIPIAVLVKLSMYLSHTSVMSKKNMTKQVEMSNTFKKGKMTRLAGILGSLFSSQFPAIFCNKSNVFLENQMFFLTSGRL
jgi:hypothetical protein